MKQLASSTLSNQNISSALLAYTHTADADRKVFFRVFLDQVAGNGDYLAYVEIQRLGSGSSYRCLPVTYCYAASSVTSICMVTGLIPVKNTDVVKVYVQGLVGDTTTPDVITEVWAEDLSDFADAVLTRDWTQVTGEAARSLLNAGRLLRNKWAIALGVLSVKKEDDATEAWNAALTADGAANPITSVDPS